MRRLFRGRGSDVGLEDEEDYDRLVNLLSQMDLEQQQVDESGGREVVWYYFRDQVEDVLGLTRGTLDRTQDVV
jgi:hypothetical protein